MNIRPSTLRNQTHNSSESSDRSLFYNKWIGKPVRQQMNVLTYAGSEPINLLESLVYYGYLDEFTHPSLPETLWKTSTPMHQEHNIPWNQVASNLNLVRNNPHYTPRVTGIFPRRLPTQGRDFNHFAPCAG